MLKVLGRASSINVRKVLWTLDELGVEYMHEAWGTGSLSLRSAEYVALNPNGLIPVLQHDGFTLWESNSICRYLASAFGRSDLLPVELRARFLVEQWMDWQATELNDAWRYAFMGLVRKSGAHQDPAAIRASLASWDRNMAILDAALARTGAYVLGAEFTLADVVLGLSVHRWQMTPSEKPDLAAVRAYCALLGQREGFRKHCSNGTP